MIHFRAPEVYQPPDNFDENPRLDGSMLAAAFICAWLLICAIGGVWLAVLAVEAMLS